MHFTIDTRKSICNECTLSNVSQFEITAQRKISRGIRASRLSNSPHGLGSRLSLCTATTIPFFASHRPPPPLSLFSTCRERETSLSRPARKMGVSYAPNNSIRDFLFIFSPSLLDPSFRENVKGFIFVC